MEPLPGRVKELIAKARVCRIATVRPSGEPHVIPVGPVFDGENLYIDIGGGYVTAAAIASDPNVAVLFDEYLDDWNKLWGVLLRCRAEPVEGEEQDSAWKLIRAKWPQHKEFGWEPRLTLALRIYDWRQWGVT
jgi:nitroimidazol reductase NimA-like FMN-containing flavoprotein (pyridoxamine 5'-phosphate oxidase superfamily)